jgi:hypothetical protein
MVLVDLSVSRMAVRTRWNVTAIVGSLRHRPPHRGQTALVRLLPIHLLLSLRLDAVVMIGSSVLAVNP